MPFYEEDLPNTTDESLRIPPSREDFIQALEAPTPRNIPVTEAVERRMLQEAKSLTDIGSRFDHYSELLVIWEEYVQMMTRRSFLGKEELVKLMGLGLACSQLQKTMANMPGYVDKIGEIKALVDGVPKDAKLIRGGRGSALNSNGYEGMGD
jgi:hypothetical protein